MPGVAARDVQFVGAGPGAVGVRTLDEASSLGDADGGGSSSLRTGCGLHTAGEQGRPRGLPRSRAGPAIVHTPGPCRVLRSLSDEPGDHFYLRRVASAIPLCIWSFIVVLLSMSGRFDPVLQRRLHGRARPEGAEYDQ